VPRSLHVRLDDASAAALDVVRADGLRIVQEQLAELAPRLVAAAAQDAGVGVLHYDRHFDALADVLSFDSRWIAPPGSLS
jgi:hypothetical protein